jgi:hypothetical protein
MTSPETCYFCVFSKSNGEKPLDTSLPVAPARPHIQCTAPKQKKWYEPEYQTLAAGEFVPIHKLSKPQNEKIILNRSPQAPCSVYKKPVFSKEPTRAFQHR